DGEEPPRRHRRGQAPRRVRRHRPGRFSGQGTGRGTRPSRRVTVNNRLSTTCSRGSRSGTNVTPVLRPCRSTGKKHPQGTPTIGFPPTETLLSPQVRSVGSFRVHLPGRSRWPNPLPSTPPRTPLGAPAEVPAPSVCTSATVSAEPTNIIQTPGEPHACARLPHAPGSTTTGLGGPGTGFGDHRLFGRGDHRGGARPRRRTRRLCRSIPSGRLRRTRRGVRGRASRCRGDLQFRRQQ